MKKSLIILSAIMILFVGCNPYDRKFYEGQYYVNSSITGDASYVIGNSAVIVNSAYITSSTDVISSTAVYSYYPYEFGLCWSTSPNPTINDSIIKDHSNIFVYDNYNYDSIISYSLCLTNLSENTTYYYKAYSADDFGVAYGEEKNFKKLGKQTIQSQTISVNGVSFKMMKVESGISSMGVTLSGYYIGETEVTQELWEAVMGNNPSCFKGSQKPVEEVSWNDCQEFITKLNELTGKNFRLPTEAEWECAARGGVNSKNYEYSGSNTVEDVAWYEDNSSETTHDVKTKSPNELGIYDMSGNVDEWCQEWYWYEGSSRVCRGGSWRYDAERCRVSWRNGSFPTSSHNFSGFRLAL